MKKRRFLSGVLREIHNPSAETDPKGTISLRQPLGKPVVPESPPDLIRRPNAVFQIRSGKKESEFASHNDWCFSGKNTTGEGNYVILEAEGRGHYCGCNLNIHNLSDSALWNWPGEGDDMIFIDDEKTPSLHGTGTEDYVNMAWCPQQEYSAPYHGIILGGKDNWMGKITYYRYHIQDPVMFEKSIRVTIEHGHNNNRSDDWSSTAYWYQTEPHKPMPPLPPKEDRLPLADEAVIWGNREPENKNFIRPFRMK